MDREKYNNYYADRNVPIYSDFDYHQENTRKNLHECPRPQYPMNPGFIDRNVNNAQYSPNFGPYLSPRPCFHPHMFHRSSGPLNDNLMGVKERQNFNHCPYPADSPYEKVQRNRVYSNVNFSHLKNNTFNMNSCQNMESLKMNQNNEKFSNECYFQKPPFSYSQLIAQAILSSGNLLMPLSEIYNYIEYNFPFFQHTKKGWQNSIRHNLSLNKQFLKISRCSEDVGKGSLWTIDKEYLAKVKTEAYKPKTKKQRCIIAGENQIPQLSDNSFSNSNINAFYDVKTMRAFTPHKIGLEDTISVLSRRSSNNSFTIENILKGTTTIDTKNSTTSLFDSSIEFTPPMDLDQLNHRQSNPQNYHPTINNFQMHNNNYIRSHSFHNLSRTPFRR